MGQTLADREYLEVNKKGLMNMALILYTDGTSKEVHPANGDHFEIEELMQIVEGQLQMIPLTDGRIMTFNEEGGPDAESGRNARSRGLTPSGPTRLSYLGG